MKSIQFSTSLVLLISITLFASAIAFVELMIHHKLPPLHIKPARLPPPGRVYVTLIN